MDSKIEDLRILKTLERAREREMEMNCLCFGFEREILGEICRVPPSSGLQGQKNPRNDACVLAELEGPDVYLDTYIWVQVRSEPELHLVWKSTERWILTLKDTGPTLKKFIQSDFMYIS